MHELKSGTKLKSAVCDAQIMIIKGLAGEHELTCGGAAMISPSQPGSGPLDPGLDPNKADGIGIGRRYVNGDETFELLCVKAGQGTLYLDGVKLEPKQAKALPSSD